MNSFNTHKNSKCFSIPLCRFICKIILSSNYETIIPVKTNKAYEYSLNKLYADH